MRDVFCPICQRWIDWENSPPVQRGQTGRPEIVLRDPRESEGSWRHRLTTSYRPCANLDQPGTHLLPYDYADYSPITIGMVGQSQAGKTHLLAAMISRLCSNDPALAPLGLQIGPLDLHSHQEYMRTNVDPLIRHRQRLQGTPANVPVAFCDALKVTNARNRSFSVSFFDIAGERLERPDDPDIRFFASANALMFVVDPDTFPARPGLAAQGDRSFDVALRRLGARERPRSPSLPDFLPVAAAVVVAKADLIRFQDGVVSDWLAQGSAEEEIDLGTVEQESADVYAYLVRRGAAPWLRPAQQCYQSTLHFASATNGPAKDDTFPGAFRQCRVLKPLLSVFAMIGILDETLLRPNEDLTT
ncbi:hypothetical protein [Streptosporangium sp. LJ11]|uniref:hypothetical protein n=1 Tax=Streptosporangium sp. LJ11 TaxID=3436927 RepID=UPI003F7A8B8F